MPVWLYITYNLLENTKRITQVPCNINKSEEINPMQPYKPAGDKKRSEAVSFSS
jgi:hypothetical protein